MNERIKELAIQAKLRSLLLLQHWGEIDVLTDSEQEELENIEKFAELIIRECGEWVSDNVADGFCEGPRLLKHFGIEE